MKKIIILLILLNIFAANYIYPAVNNETLFEQGMEAFNSGNYGISELIFRKILDSDNDEYNDKAWFYHARSIFQQKKYKSAIFEFNSLLNKCRTMSLAIEARYWIGESYFYLNDFIKAIEEYKRYIEKSKDGVYVAICHDRIGDIYNLQKRYDEAIVEWEHALSKSNDKEKNAVRVLNIGQALFNNQQYDEAIKRLNPILTSRTDQKVIAMTRMTIGKIYQINGNHTKALLHFNGIPYNLLNEHPFNEIRYFMAKSYIELGNMNSAKSLLDLFVQGCKESSWYYDGLYELGTILIESKNNSEGINHLENVRKSSTKPELKLKATKKLTTIYMNSNPEKAIPYLEESLSMDNTDHNREIILFLGKTYIKVQRFNDAEELFKNYMNKYPNDEGIDEIKFLQAKIYLEKGEIDKAKDLFQKLQKDHPFSNFYNELNYHLAQVEFKKKNIKKTITLLNQYIKQNKIINRYEAYLLLLDSYIKNNDLKNAGHIIDIIIKGYIQNKDADAAIFKYAKAINKKGLNADKYYNIIIKKFPDSESTMNLYLMFGNNFFKKKNYQQAIEYYNKYLSGNVKKNKGLVFYNILISLYSMKKYKDIIVLIDKGNLPPMDENQWKEIPLILGRSHYNLHDYNNAYRVLHNENIKNYPKNDIMIYSISAIYAGDIESAKSALDLLENNIELYAELLYTIGKFYFTNNKYDDAMSYYSRVVNECPSSKYAESAKIGLSEIFIKKKKYKNAINSLTETSENDLQDKKIPMLIVSYFKTGENDKAVTLTKKHLNQVLKSDYGEMIIKNNVQCYYEEKDIKEFNLYAKYLAKYKGNTSLINYLSGKIHFEEKQFQNAYKHFYNLTLSKNKYIQEAKYYLAQISLFIHDNKKNAEKYFNDIINDKNGDKKLKLLSKINLSIIFHETHKSDKSKQYLKDVIESKERGNVMSQAMNLYEIYGYNK